jgi:hypothetical protein
MLNADIVLGFSLLYLCVSENSISYNEKGVMFMSKYYTVKTTKYGRDWKKISEGLEFLEDDKLYRMEFHAKGLIQYIRAKKAFRRNERFKYYIY